MFKNKYHIRRALWGILLTGSVAWAGSPEYMGFTLNVNSKSDVEQTLKARNATFSSNYGYRGYGQDLPIIKVMHDPIMNTKGQIDEAWLSFTPDKKLYQISVTWRDAGKTYTVIKDVFDSKYKLTNNTGRGFIKKHTYKNGDTKITLSRNSFGFGESQKTSVEYLYLPALSEVKSMKKKIDNAIKTKNMKQKGVNL